MAKPNGQEMVVIFKNEQNAVKLAEEMDRFINNFSVDKDGFIEALKAEEQSVITKFTVISLLWLKKMNHYYSRQWYDLRNEYSVQLCHRIYKLLGEEFEGYADYKGFIDDSDYLKWEQEEEDIESAFEFEIDFVEKLGRTHRTLQQTFSEIVFRWLGAVKDVSTDTYLVEVSTAINQNLDSYEFRTPFV